MSELDQRRRFVLREFGPGARRLELGWDHDPDLDLACGHDLVFVAEPWDLDQDPHPLLDVAIRHLHREGALVLSVRHRPYRNLWQQREPAPSLGPLHLQALLESRFARVELWHQNQADGWAVLPGATDGAEIYLAVARAPRPAPQPVRASIVIPVYDQSALTTACLRALEQQAQADRIPIEVIVVDNASRDRTGELLHHALFNRWLNLRVIRNPQNLGFAKASNQGALIARGEVVVFLNNDTEVQPGWLAPLLDELAANPTTGAVGARLLYADRTIQHAGVAIGRRGIPCHVHLKRPAEDSLVLERREFPVVTGACLAVRRREFIALGMFDEGYVNGSEDIDLCFRYRQRGQQCIYRPDSLTLHHEGRSEGRLARRDQNVERLLDRWRDRLVQDDFRYATREDHRERPERSLRFALKIGVPNRTHQNWGDVPFAEGLARSLCAQGHECQIHYLNEWGRDDRDIDVVIHIKGLSRYVPKPWNINFLWMINHPSLHSDEELARYDAVLVASTTHAAELRRRLTIPVIDCLQATDPDHFAPRPDVNKRWDLVFVGNNGGADRESMRRVIADLLPTRHRLAVWGGGWQGLLPEGVWQGKYVPPEELPALYASAWIVLNDHQREMREHGFLNNRTFDALACGAIVVSDHVEGAGEGLPIHTYRTREELHAVVDRLLADRRRASDETAAARPQLVEQYAFAGRARMLAAMASVRLDHKPAPPVTTVQDSPLVSVLIATKDRLDLLPEALATLRAQSYPRWELLLVNDGGASPAELVQACADPRIRLIELPENRGKGTALNTAARAARGSIFAHQDDDDVWRPDHLERLLLPLMHVPGVRFAYGAALDVQLERTPEGLWRQTRRHLIYDRATTPEDLFFYNQIQGITAAHHRELFFDAGGYDERLKVLIDWDLWRRIAALAPPYYIGRVTAERTLRAEPASSGEIHLTRLIDRDPVAYYINRMRILRKPLPFPAGSEQQTLLAKLRTDGRWDLLVMIGEQRLRRGQIEKASRTFLRAAALRPERAAAWRGLGYCLLRLGQPREALQAYGRTVVIGPTQPTDYLYGAVAALAIGDPDSALVLLDALAQTHEDLSEAHRVMAADYRARALAKRPGVAAAS